MANFNAFIFSRNKASSIGNRALEVWMYPPTQRCQWHRHKSLPIWWYILGMTVRLRVRTPSTYVEVASYILGVILIEFNKAPGELVLGLLLLSLTRRSPLVEESPTCVWFPAHATQKIVAQCARVTPIEQRRNAALLPSFSRNHYLGFMRHSFPCFVLHRKTEKGRNLGSMSVKQKKLTSENSS